MKLINVPIVPARKKQQYIIVSKCNVAAIYRAIHNTDASTSSIISVTVRTEGDTNDEISTVTTAHNTGTSKCK